MHAIAFDPEDPDVIYAGGDVCGVYRYSIVAGTWTPWSQGLGFADLNWSYYVDDLLVLGAVDGVPLEFRGVYAATWGGVYFRPDDQTPWTCVSTDAVYSTGFAANRGGSMRVPFSSLGYDATTQTLYAGAGHGRTEDQFAGAYRYFYPSSCSTTSCPGEFSLWSCDLSGNTADPEFQYVPGTDHGKTRQIAIADYIGSDQVPRHEVIYSTDTGIWSVGAVDPLWSVATANKSQAFDPTMDAINPWGVVVGNDATCYILTWPSSGSLASGIWQYDLKIWPRTGTSPTWSRVVGESDYFWPHAETFSQFLNNSGGDLSDLSIVWNEDGGRDALYVGAGVRRASRPGYLRYGDYNLGGTPTWGWANIHGKSDDVPGYEMGAEMFVADWRHGQIDSTHLSADEVGWHSYDFSMRSLTQFAVNRGADTIMVAVDYAVPMLTTNGGASWQNLYCTGSDAAGWTTRGLNLLCTGSSTFLPDGELVIGALDYGVFVGATPQNESFLHLRDGNWGIAPDWPNGVDVEVLVRNGSREYFMVDTGSRDSPVPRSFIWTWTGLNWESISGGLVAALGGDGTTEIEVKDIVFHGEDRIYAAVGKDVTPTSSPWRQFHYYVCEGTRPASGTDWLWQTRLSADPSVPALAETRLVHRMCLVPGTDLLMLATKHKGTSAGGLFPVDLTTWQLGSAWLGGDYTGGSGSSPPAAALGRLGVNVTAVEADRLGSYIYAGTGGGDLPRSPGRGGLVRFPLSNGVPGAPEILAGVGDVGVGDPDAGDVFAISPVTNFENLNHGTTRDWEFCTRINDIEIDPNNPRVAHVAVGAGNIPFYHGSFGAWRVSDAGWTHVWGGHETGSGAKTVGISPVDRAHLYVGSVGQEFFRADITPSNHPDIAATASHPLLAAMSDTVQVLAVHIAADTTVVTVEASLDSLGLPGEKLVLLDDGQGEDVAEGDGVFTSPRFAAPLTAGTGHSVRVFAQDATGGYDEREVAVEAVAGYARFVDVSKGTGDLYTSLPDSADHLPYSSVYFNATSDPASKKVMVITFDDNVTAPLMFERWYVDDRTPWFERRSGTQVYPSWIDTLAPGSRGLTAADFDNDANALGVSDADFFICNPVSGGRLYRSHFAQGTELFTDVTDTLFGVGAGELAGAITAAWGHFDSDNFIDLAVATTTYVNPVKNLGGTAPSGSVIKIFRNVGGTRFELLPYSGISGGPNICLSMDWADLDQDGDEDLVTWHYLTYGGAPFMMLNLGHDEVLGRHVMVPTSLDIQDTWAGGMSVCEIDYDHDWDATNQVSYPDLLVTESYGQRRAMILRNLLADGSPTLAFETIPLASGRDWSGAVAKDLDLNGQVDALLLPQDGQPELHLGTAGGTSPTYRDLAFTAGLRPGATSGALTQDLNDDGKPDLFLGRIRGDQFLYRSAPVGVGGAGPAHWLRVNLGTVGNSDRSLLGTAVTVTAGGVSQTRVVSGGGNRGGQPSNELLFGLGAAAGSAAVTVRYRSGEIDQFTTAVDTTVVAMEDQPVVLKPSTKNDPNPVFSYELAPGNATWVFRWRTVGIKGDLAQDVVHVENHLEYEASDPCYIGIAPGATRVLRLNDPGVAHTVYRIGDDWQHEVRWGALPCQEDCVYRFWVTSGLGNGVTVSSPPKLITPIDYCIPDLQE